MSAHDRSSAQPSVGQIYDAFAADTHRVFRAAMRRSVGGILRLCDITWALAQMIPEIWRAVASLGPAAGRADDLSSERGIPSNQPPLANEPAVREALRFAFEIARAQLGELSGVLTPACLAAGLAIARLGRLTPEVERVLSSLDLVCPEHFRPAPVPVADISPTPPEMSAAELVDAVIDVWLSSRDLPPGPELDAKKAAIAQLLRRLNVARESRSPSAS